ncbi:phenylalanine--tRNA ligase subunit alpha [Legionella jordanis]|uniref:Phenylalanine--tRNA ligase alpha subunit n=1 Tax=Legionella jordanis TaxID=456 RepID=A0A0W0VCG0_9GAMM|nr:phenylalanine--tRNA ligase subunit alpha [Legionella jordanis]KTD17542.1 phenylalanyl-tRNA synthetase, alpha subunit [Legionella jordanis]RMX05120.1 phenylalanine--tRNA ligase subunit alpha [Legionella jordanis]RMX17376.1 phenylalanine--tRNA ligase subunit alpha [Legionella jordanis]VEH13511.1 phenylalanyl-tRNA synthetase, alpha subunit [Legionella jordanis]HAT8714428.1 phenylalanine--tRNA ligase subunit alpha [Legionella jordanis]
MQDINRLQQQASEAIAKANDLATLEAIRVDYLGKKGQLTEILKSLAHLSAEERPKVGQFVNQAKREISSLIEEKVLKIKEIQLEEKLHAERIDVTLPGRRNKPGSLHPVSQVKQCINDYFSRLGFDIVTGPEIETEFYNFEALNIPDHHPARAMHDTFYFGDGRLLRTHTSPVQIRTMEKRTPPLRLIAPGRVYRCDSDVTHTPMFHQVEGLLIDKQATLAGLKGLLQDFFAYFFGRQLALRFRASYFPFTEPSAEVDIECTQCFGKGCRSCKFTGWLEVLGCGMVHPNVLKAVGISPEEYQGWAFGMGIDRLAMLYFGIEDLRMMFENDLTFLKQF